MKYINDHYNNLIKTTFHEPPTWHKLLSVQQTPFINKNTQMFCKILFCSKQHPYSHFNVENIINQSNRALLSEFVYFSKPIHKYSVTTQLRTSGFRYNLLHYEQRGLLEGFLSVYNCLGMYHLLIIERKAA